MVRSVEDFDHTINYNITGSWLENNVQVNDAIVKFLDDYWDLSIYSAIVYVIAIFAGRKFMQSYARFDLSYLLAAWSGCLAVFSLLGTIRFAPNVIYALQHQSFHDSVCTVDWTYLPVVRFWISLFSISKIVELGDTVFIVLRKQPLIFLHWYHHITVLIYTWYSYADRTSSGRWYIAMNYAVHSVMYSYYAMRAMKYRAPQWIRMGITLFQLSQMVVGVYIGIYVYKLKQANVPCGVTDNNMRLSFLMYFSYFLLFLKFFYEAYINPPKRPAAKPTNKADTNGSQTNGHVTNGSTANGFHLPNGATNGLLNGGAKGDASNNNSMSNGHTYDLRKRN